MEAAILVEVLNIVNDLARGLGSRAAAASRLSVVAAAALALSMGACSPGDSEPDACITNRTFFETDVWAPFMGSTCFTCHGPNGEAELKGARFQLQSPQYPDFINANLANLSEVAKIKVEGKSELLVKPIGGANHGGGAVLSPSGPEYQALVELVQRLDSGGPDCTEGPNKTLRQVKLLDPARTLRKATLDLAGRLPTKAEMERVAKGGEPALDAAIDQLMKEATFLTRIREIWNDLLLTDRFLLRGLGLLAINFMETDHSYPALKPYASPDMGLEPDDLGQRGHDPYRLQINRAIAQEPLNFITYVVQQEKPFSDVAAGQYAVVNPYLARAYGLENIHFKDPTDYDEWHEAQVTLGTGVKVPHAGILSTPSFLNRWQTTPTNRDRGRARRVFLFLLATDILKLADRPVDPTSMTHVVNPTETSTYCTVCHHVIDPVAGGFRGYDPIDYEVFDPKAAVSGWYTDMFAAGYDGKQMPAEDYARGLPWLGTQVARDPRFLYNAVVTTYKGFTGHDPIAYPTNVDDPNFDQMLVAWSAQDAFFQSVVAKFSKSNLNLKVVVKAIIESPYYRATTAVAGADPNAITDLGTARLLTPEMLSRKIKAIFGYSWTPKSDLTHDPLVQEYLVTYGGIDSYSVTTRLTTPNGVMWSVQQRMANEMGCHATALDFTKNSRERNLFPSVELSDVPEVDGKLDARAAARIKANVVHLHELVLGDLVDAADPEVERTYQLFVATWRELSHSRDKAVPYECQGRWDWAKPKGKGDNAAADLPSARVIGDDPNYTMRSWQAVITYLLSDYSFLYE